MIDVPKVGRSRIAGSRAPAGGRSRRRPNRGVLTALAVCALALLWAPGAQAYTAHCGETITQSVTLGRDVSNCTGNGLNVGADDIRIDLNGHTVSSEGPTGGVFGIDFQGHSGVNVRNGVVKGFQDGMRVLGNGNRVQYVTVRDSWNRLGIVVQGNGNTLTSNRISNIDNEAAQVTGVGNTLTYNAVDHTPFGFSVLFGASNAVTNNRLEIPGGCCSVGITVAGETQDTIAYNKITNGADTSIRLFCLNSTDFIHANTVSGGRLGFSVEDSGVCDPSSGAGGARLVGNRASNASEAGFRVSGNDPAFGDELHRNIAQSNDVGFALLGTTNALLEDNTAGSGSAQSGGTPGNHRGIVVADQSKGTRLIDNGANNNTTGDGIFLESSTSDTALVGNVANRNAGNGIEDQSGSATFTSNIASYNQLFGILAAPGDTDGGGNQANHNGAGQCTNVAC